MNDTVIQPGAQGARVRHMTLDDLRRRGDLDDCIPGPPHSLSGLWSIDAEIAAAATCDVCDAGPLTYRPFHSRKGHIYVAVLVCPACGQADLL